MTTTESTQSATLGKLLEDRWSCRGFLPDSVPRTTIEEVLDLAGQSPSWCNTQPWHTIVTAGAGTERFRAALSVHASQATELKPDFEFPLEYSGVYQERRRECGLQLYESVGVARGDRVASAREAQRNFSFFDAPHTAVVTTPADLGTYGAIDCGLYVGTFLLAAQSHGLGAIPQAAFAAHSDFIKQFFELPDDRKVVCGISFGYADDSHPANGFRTSRARLDESVSWMDS
jgi:nitroreductase